MSKNIFKTSIFIYWFIFVSCSLNAATTFQIPITQQTVIIDGILDDVLWREALEVKLSFETSPAENTIAPIITTARIIRNNEFLYISFKASDPQPGEISARLRDRDSLLADDWVGIVLDTFNDERRSYAFYINPLGSQMDFIYNDVLKKEDNSWDTVWQSAGRLTDDGYQVEVAIPFQSIKYSESEKDEIWGINFMRNYPRNVQYRFSNIRVDRNKNCLLCQYDKFTGMKIAENGDIGLEIIPSLSVIRSDSRSPVITDWQSDGADKELGLDISWNLNSENSLSATINPDFSQIESDALQLDVNTPFALFFPEKRTFFLESTDYFQTPVNTVFTRNIVDPDYGLKMTGKSNGHMYGAFYAGDTVTSFIIPGSLSSSIGILDSAGESFVGRYRQDIGEASTLGGLVTSRQSGDYSNDLFSIDGRYSFNEQHSLSYQALRSETRYPDELAIAHQQTLGNFDGDGLYVNYEHKNRDWTNSIRYRNYSNGLRADMGFLSKVGYERMEFYNDRYLYGDESNWWNKIRLHINWTVTHDTNDKLIRQGSETAIEIRGPMQSAMYFNRANVSEYWNGTLYDTSFFETFFQVLPNNKLTMQLATIVGNEIDLVNNRPADTTEISFWVQYSFTEHFTVSTDFAFSELEFQNDRIFTALINDFRLSYQFDLKHRLELTLQNQYIDKNQAMYLESVNEIAKNFATRLIYSYKLNPRTVIYAGYSDNAIASDEINSLFKTQKTAFFKFSYSFEM